MISNNIEIPYYLRPEFQYQQDNPFLDTRRFAPVANGFDLPDSQDPFFIEVENWDERIKDDITRDCIIDEVWWNIQYERCLNGYTVPYARQDGSSVTITGRHYFYMNFWYIYGKKTREAAIKTLCHPRFTDLDYEIFWEIESMFQMGKDDMFLKARQKGFTEKIAGGVIGYNYTFIPHSVNIIIAGNQDDSDKAMSNVVRGLDQLINTQFYKERKKNTTSKITAKNYGTYVEALTAGSQGMQSVSRFSPFFVYYEEVGKWAKGLVRATKEFVDPALHNEGTKTGFSIYVGTGGDIDSGAADLELMHLNPAANKLLEFDDTFEPEGQRNEKKVSGFVPSWKYCIVDDDGNSLKEESIKWHEEQAKLKNKEAEILYWVNNPVWASQAFMVPSGGYFGDKTQGKLLERRTLILVDDALKIVEHGNLVWKNKNKWAEGVEFIPGPDKDGKTTVVITERPKIDPKTKEPYINLYKQGTDSYDRDKANTSKSLGSSIVAHGFLNANEPSNYIVARLTIRPELHEGGASKFYEETLKLNLYYNSINLIEYSNLVIFQYYKDRGFNYLLKETPMLMISRWVENSQQSQKYGIDPSTKHHWLSQLNDLIIANDYDFVNKIFDIDILAALAKFKYVPGSKSKHNCDITMSLALIAVLLEDEKELATGYQHAEDLKKMFNFTFKRSNEVIKRI